MLVVCNGHGEDLIALRILEALHDLEHQLPLSVLPLVGEGKAFTLAMQQGWLRMIGPRAQLPSGGFSNQSARGLLADLVAGLPLLTWRQWRCLRRESKQVSAVLAVGDLLPLLMAWGSRQPFGFIGTPKSDYTWSSGPKRHLSDTYHRLKGSEWDPWEWALMGSKRCQLVAMRDRLTARGLRRHGVQALAPGNPMMDGLKTSPPPAALERCRRLLLLCGSRMPEALRNAERLLRSLQGFQSDVPLTLLMATGSRPSEEALQPMLHQLGFRPCPPPAASVNATACWVNGAQMLLLGSGRFNQWASWAEVGLATAGTATEQLVGLGIPSLSLPGRGPQFTQGFAERQSRLLGGAVRTCGSAAELQRHLTALLADTPLRETLGRIGRQRMGGAGGSRALAQLVIKRLIADTDLTPALLHGQHPGP
ncbi:MAG: lipid-A-disaccharide synthase-related protein [Synechococcus sp.]|nr:lipid-A-disaccharide synthase-related protein [Synechococcus sp.]